jgi:hypothetical protein
MPNMSYCRFENTARAVDDCLENLHKRSLSTEEHYARMELISLAKEIVDQHEKWMLQTRTPEEKS